ncbi:class I fructose-bisphosphate aldolase [Nanoarchaeota archaeon]
MVKRKITKKGRVLALAYDQGMEHGTDDFNDKNVNPEYIFEIARKGGVTAIVVQKGIAERYYDKKKDVPLIVKLNGKTKLRKGEALSLQVCSVKEALRLGASAVGYTVYFGSKYEAQMMKEFGKIEEECDKAGIPAILWAYPRGKDIKKITPRIIEYAAREGLELGAEMVKVNYTGSLQSFKKVVRAAGRCKVVSLGGGKRPEKELLVQARDTIKAGGVGMIVGRNIWQHKDPIAFIKKLKKEIWK